MMTWSSARLLAMVRVAAIVAGAEFMVMYLLHFLDLPEGPLEYVVDSVLLVALSSPFLYVCGKKLAPPSPYRKAPDPSIMQVLPLEQLERQALTDALEITHGDRSAAAKLLGIGRSTIYRKVKEYGLEAAVKP